MDKDDNPSDINQEKLVYVEVWKKKKAGADHEDDVSVEPEQIEFLHRRQNSNVLKANFWIKNDSQTAVVFRFLQGFPFCAPTLIDMKMIFNHNDKTGAFVVAKSHKQLELMASRDRNYDYAVNNKHNPESIIGIVLEYVVLTPEETTELMTLSEEIQENWVAAKDWNETIEKKWANEWRSPERLQRKLVEAKLPLSLTKKVKKHLSSGFKRFRRDFIVFAAGAVASIIMGGIGYHGAKHLPIN